MRIQPFTRWTAGFLFTLICLTIQAQVPITTENFESYTAGARLCTQAPAVWRTWNNGPGTAEDPLVTDSLAFQGAKSLWISGTNDVLLNLAGKTTGRYEVAFYVRIPTGKVGFYGILHDFSGNDSEWGLQCSFDAATTGSIEAGGNTVEFPFSHNQWIPVRNIIDLDNDDTQMYINGSLVAEWQWSRTMTGIPGVSRLDALNFFAWNAAQREPSMFLDSLVYKQIAAPDPPRNLTATVNQNIVSLAWQPPASGTPLGYKVYRDSVIMSSNVTSLTWVDQNVYPGTYSYSVKAISANGLSQPAGPATATVAGGTARQLVLVEIGTGTWCTYCPGASMGADDLLSNGKDVAVIEYHDNDPYANTDAEYRDNTFYHMPGLPTTWFDGVDAVIGGNATQSIYPRYLPVYTHRIPKLSLFTIETGVKHQSERVLRVAVTARKIYPYTGTNIRLHMVLTESHIPQTWQTIMHELNAVCRKMYPDYHGTAASFSGDSLTVNYDITIDSSYNFSNCELIAFLQDNATKEVLQVDQVKLSALGMGDPNKVNVSVYPNPTSGILFINSDMPVSSVRMLDLIGRQILFEGLDTTKIHLDLSGIKPGSYILIIGTLKGPVIRKIMISPSTSQ